MIVSDRGGEPGRMAHSPEDSDYTAATAPTPMVEPGRGVEHASTEIPDMDDFPFDDIPALCYA